MKELSKNELKQVVGGEDGTILIIIEGEVLLIGVIDGYMRPLPCN